MATTKILGFVITNQDYLDGARIVTTYTKQLGKVAFYAPGVNKTISKNKYSIQTFSMSEFEIFKSRNPEKMSKLKTGNLVQSLNKIALNYTEYIYASGITKVLDLGTDNNVKNYKLFKMTWKALENFNDQNKSFITYIFFLAFFLKWTGGEWVLNKCVRCQKKQTVYRRFDYDSYGLVCSNCILQGENKQPISFINLFLEIDKSNFYTMIEKHYKIEDLIALHIILVNYYENALGYSVNSFEILKTSASFKVPANVEESYK